MQILKIISEHYETNYKYILIGDTENDISSAVDLNIKAIFVKSGIRSKWILYDTFKDFSNIICIKDISNLKSIEFKS